MTTSEAAQAMVKVLAPYIGHTMAHAAIEAHCRRLSIPGDRISPEQLESLLGKLAAGLNIFVGRDKSAAVIDEVRRALDQLETGR